MEKLKVKQKDLRKRLVTEKVRMKVKHLVKVKQMEIDLDWLKEILKDLRKLMDSGKGRH